MIKGFEDIYFVKKLYFDCGRTIIDYLYRSYLNLSDRGRLEQICEKLTTSDRKYISIYDTTGRSFTLLCNMAGEKYSHKSDIFFYKDDFSSADKLMGLYISAENRFIILAKEGMDISTYYYHFITMKYPVEKYLSMAESYFEKSEYIAKKQ